MVDIHTSSWISYQNLMVNSQVINNALRNPRRILPFLIERQAWNVLAVVPKHVTHLFSLFILVLPVLRDYVHMLTSSV